MNSIKEGPSRHTSAARQEKATLTDSEARKIVTAEALARVKKTEKLRALRLQQAATVQDEPAPVVAKKKKK